MSHFNNNGKAVWGPNRPDTFPTGASRRQNPNFNNRRFNGGFTRQPRDEGELENRPMAEAQTDEPLSNKLDRVLDKLEKIDMWKDETDRRFDSLDPFLSREVEPPLGFDDDREGVMDDARRRGTVDRGYRTERR